MKISGLGRFAIPVSLLLLGTFGPASPPAGYHLLKKIPLGAAPGGGEYFDYITVDAPARRVYLTHGTEVKVVDADSGEVVGTISGMKRNHGVALVNELGKGFITDADSGKVVIFDIATLKVTGEVQASKGAHGVIYDPASKHIFSFNDHSKNMTVIDPKTQTVVKTLDLGGPSLFAVADGKGMIYANNQDTNEVVAIDSRALTINARWPVAPAGEPMTLTMDREHRRLLAAGRNPQMLVMMDADNGKVIQSFPITAGVDVDVYEPETRMLFVSTREGNIHIFHEDSPDKLSEVETITTEFGAKTMALDPKTYILDLTTSDFCQAPATSAKVPHPSPVPIPGTFRLLIYGR
jgi:hypothetical protein